MCGGRIHFRNAGWFVPGEVVQEEPADVEQRLGHVGAEGFNLRQKQKGLKKSSLQMKTERCKQQLIHSFLSLQSCPLNSV